MSATCQWPRCNEPALCESGNFRNRLVCRDHFDLTNGGGHELEVLRADDELLADESGRLRRQRDSLLAALRDDLLPDFDDAVKLIDDEIGGDFAGTVDDMKDAASRARKVLAEVEAAP